MIHSTCTSFIVVSMYMVAIHSVSRNILSGRYYITINEEMSWTDANAYCHNEYGTTLAPHSCIHTQPCVLQTDECSQFWAEHAPSNDTSASCALYVSQSQSFNNAICTNTLPFVCGKVTERIDCETLDGWNTVTQGGHIEVVEASPRDYDNCIRISGDINDNEQRELVYVERDFDLRLKEKVIIHYTVVTEGLELSGNDKGFAEYFCNGDESNANKVHFNEYLQEMTHFTGVFDLSLEIDCDTVTLRIGGDVNGYLDEIHLRAVVIEYVVPPTNAPSRAPTNNPTASATNKPTPSPSIKERLSESNESSYHMTWLIASGGVLVVLFLSAVISFSQPDRNRSSAHKTPKDIENQKHEDRNKVEQTKSSNSKGLSMADSLQIGYDGTGDGMIQ
eukprot:1070775_1